MAGVVVHFFDIEPSELAYEDLAPVDLQSPSSSIGSVGKSGSTWEWSVVDDKWLEVSSDSSEVEPSESSRESLSTSAGLAASSDSSNVELSESPTSCLSPPLAQPPGEGGR
jgi:hypothetical protein